MSQPSISMIECPLRVKLSSPPRDSLYPYRLKHPKSPIDRKQPLSRGCGSRFDHAFPVFSRLVPATIGRANYFIDCLIDRCGRPSAITMGRTARNQLETPNKTRAAFALRPICPPLGAGGDRPERTGMFCGDSDLQKGVSHVCK